MDVSVNESKADGSGEDEEGLKAFRIIPDADFHKELGHLKEISEEAAWQLSSAKPSNGVSQLRDNNLSTFWQSDGPQPHQVSVLFHKKTKVECIAFFVDFKEDESYTPSELSIRIGSGFNATRQVVLFELKEPSGWVVVPLVSFEEAQAHCKTHILQFCVLNSHQNGRDTHIRQMKVFGPRQPETLGQGTELSEFSTVHFKQYSQIR
jgi:anaphase-promoting complex subunit 10